MAVLVSLFALTLIVAVATLQARRAMGTARAGALGLGLFTLLGGAWGGLEWARQGQRVVDDPASTTPVAAQSCVRCHEGHYRSWHRTYHRTMTREATPENVKADFDNATMRYGGVTSRMTRDGDRFYIDTVDPGFAIRAAASKIPLDQAGEIKRRIFPVDLVVGSHWFQQMMSRDEYGRYFRLPLAYHIEENRWIHVQGAFLTPDAHFFAHMTVWNETCVYCHNTRPAKNPTVVRGVAAKEFTGYRTEVSELGISCETCHGPGEAHVLAHQNPAQRLAQRYSDEPDPTIINPARLPVERSMDVCARCHGGPVQRREAWNQRSFADPFFAGRDLSHSWFLPWSEADIEHMPKGKAADAGRNLGASRPPGPLDGRFWGDGTPLTTAVEYQGIAQSACYEKGHGKMTCLTCHSMHDADPNLQVKEGMKTNAACYACHGEYRERLAAHTHHAAGSEGSNCYNCHMPHQVYSLLKVHRSHRISIPHVRDSRGTGKPHACNLCHLDKSLGWTQDHLEKWYGMKPEPLTDDERGIASSVLHLAQSDARTRAVFAGAFSWSPAQQASGRSWPGLLLLPSLDHERYEAVRYLMYRGVRSIESSGRDEYNYQGSPAERAEQLLRLRDRLRSRHDGAKLDRKTFPYLPLTADGAWADEEFRRLLRDRNDPDVSINE